MANASFAGVEFDALSNGFSDKGGGLEEWRVPIHVATAADWGALFALRTPHEYLSIRFCPSAAGTITTTLDIGGGFGEGALLIDTLDAHTAVLTDLESQSPIGATEHRLGTATFVVTG